MGQQVEFLLGRLKFTELPTFVDSCADHGNTTVVQTIVDSSNVFFLHKLSFHWVSPIGMFSVIGVGTAVSYLTGALKDEDIDPQLISPVLHRFLPKSCSENFGKTRGKATANYRAPRNQVIMAPEATLMMPKRASEANDQLGPPV